MIYQQIAAISLSIRKHIAEKTPINAIKFITSAMIPPPKKDVLAALRIPLATGESPAKPNIMVRKADVDVRNHSLKDW